MSIISTFKLIQKRKYPLDILHFNTAKETCKPHKLYTCILGQHDPGKTPMGKTSWRENLLWSFKEMLQQRNTLEQLGLQQQQIPSLMKTLLEVCALLGITAPP
jgi:hypothetical protein